MGYYKSGIQTTKYRVTVEEYKTWTETPDQDEMKKPQSVENFTTPKAIEKEEWVVVDQTVTSRRGVLASALRGIADEVEPKKPVTRDPYA
jgi:hypothetical protein